MFTNVKKYSTLVAFLKATFWAIFKHCVILTLIGPFEVSSVAVSVSELLPLPLLILASLWWFSAWWSGDEASWELSLLTLLFGMVSSLTKEPIKKEYSLDFKFLKGEFYWKLNFKKAKLAENSISKNLESFLKIWKVKKIYLAISTWVPSGFVRLWFRPFSSRPNLS